MSLLAVYAADNIIYLRKSGIGGIHRHIVLVNGANGETVKQFTLAHAGNINEVLFFKIADFNNDGRDDIYYLRKDDPDGSGRYQEIRSGADGHIIWRGGEHGEGFITNVQNIEVGDFNGDECDDLYFLYQSTTEDEMWRYVVINIADDKMVQHASLPNSANIKEIVFTKVADFNEDGKEDVWCLYKDGGSNDFCYFVQDIANNKVIWQEQVTEISHINKILFSEIGDFNGDGRIEIYLLYRTDNEEGNLYYSVIDIINSQQLFSEKIEGVDDILFLKSGDFNGDGSDDIYYLYKDSVDEKMNYHLVKDFSNNQSLLQGNILDAKDANTILFVNIGDFDGDGRDDLHYIRTADPQGKSYYQVAKSITNDAVIWEGTVKNAGYANKLAFVKVSGPVARYMSYPDDRAYKALNFEGINGEPIFPIGWYTSLDHWQEPNGGWPRPIKTILKEITTYSPTNYVLAYLPPKYYVTQNIEALVDYISSLSNPQNVYPKISMVSLLEGTDVPHDTSDAIFRKNFTTLNSMSTLLEPSILGWYVGDDTWWNVNFPKLRNLVEFVHNNSNKFHNLTFATNTWDAMKKTFAAQKVYYDVPMLQEYIYKEDKPSGSNENATAMIQLTKTFGDLRDSLTAHDKLGFFYIAQAHGDYFIGLVKGPYAKMRRPSWYESRYVIFDAIIHGAAGIALWSYIRSDKFDINDRSGKNVINNLNYIAGEITNSPLEEALINGNVPNFPVLCSKDGYDNESLGDPGSQIADINYIVRHSNGFYYLLVINNSNIKLNNVRFFLPFIEIKDKSIREVVTQYDGIKMESTIDVAKMSKNGKKHITFDITLNPFEVKIFRIGARK